MQIKNAASVLPDPVGAEIRVVSPARMCGQPWTCGSVGVANRRTNQSRTNGCAHSNPGESGSSDSAFMALPSILPRSRNSPGRARVAPLGAELPTVLWVDAFHGKPARKSLASARMPHRRWSGGFLLRQAWLLLAIVIFVPAGWLTWRA